MKQIFAKICLIAMVLTMVSGLVGASSAQAGGLYAGGVLVSTAGSDNYISYSNRGRKVATDSEGRIYVAYASPTRGIRVARSTDRGRTFDTDVQVSSDEGQVDIAADPISGNIFVTWVVGSSAIKFARSTDHGASFSSVTTVDTTGAISVHLAVASPHVYIITNISTKFYYNANSGVGSFTSVNLDSSRVYADVGVNPYSGTVYAQNDDPNVLYYISGDHGHTFDTAHNPGINVHFSVASFAFDETHGYMYISGDNYSYDGDSSVRVNLNTNTLTNLSLTPSTVPNGRSLSSDAVGNLVSGFNSGASVKFEVSQDFGAHFSSPVTVATADNLNVAVNPLYGDVVAAYQVDGKIYVSTYQGLLAVVPHTNTLANSSSGALQFILKFAAPVVKDISVLLNGGKQTTASSQVNLDIKVGSDIRSMAISNDPRFTGVSIEPLAATKSWQLCSSDCVPGKTYTVYAKFFTEFGQSVTIPQTITYDPNLGSEAAGGEPIAAEVQAPSFIFTKDLRPGVKDADVIELQKYLNAHGFPIAASGPGSAGQEVDSFGKATRRALAKFQEAHRYEILAPLGIDTANGFFGKATRDYLNQHP